MVEKIICIKKTLTFFFYIEWNNQKIIVNLQTNCKMCHKVIKISNFEHLGSSQMTT